MAAFFKKKYKRKRKGRGISYPRLGVIGIILIVAMGLLGASYASWTQKFHLFSTISTGHLHLIIKEAELESADCHQSFSLNVHKEGGIVNQVDLSVVTGFSPFNATLVFSVENNGTLPVVCTGIDANREGDLALEILEAPPVISVGETGLVRVGLTKGYCDNFEFRSFLRFEQAVLSTFSRVMNASYALWNHDAEVTMVLTITPPDPDEEDFECGDYSTIQEGIYLLRDIKYPYLYEKTDDLQNVLEARIQQLNELPFGGITLEELQAEYDGYQSKLDNLGTMINKYGQCINALGEFYNNSSQEEKGQVPDFWSIYSSLWNLHTELWVKRGELYNKLSEFWIVGHSKIDYNN
jgi:hypothetical protein